MEAIVTKLMTPAEERSLMAELKSLQADPGRRAAYLAKRNAFVERWVPLTLWVAKRYFGKEVAAGRADDCVQMGVEGLMDAVDRFDPGRGVKFVTYAQLWVRQAITMDLYNTGLRIRVPVHAREMMNKWNRQNVAMRKRSGVAADPADVTATLGLSPGQKVCLAAAWRVAKVALESEYATAVRANREGSAFAGMFIVDKETAFESAVAAEDAEELYKALVVLTDTERVVLTARFGLEDGQPRTLREVGVLIGRTRERVRQIEELALRKLRGHYDEVAA